MQKVLLFMGEFFGYYNEVIKSMKKMNYDVTWFSDKISMSLFSRIAYRFSDAYKKNKFDKYFFKCINKVKGENFEKIIIIFGAQFFQTKHFFALKKYFPQSKLIYYAWDSVINFPIIKEFFGCCDIAYTFDKVDAHTYGVNYLPLFYCKTYNYKKNYDYCIIMSLYKNKMEPLIDVLKQLPKLDNKFIYFKIMDPLFKLFLFFKYHKFYKENINYFHYKSLKYEDFIKFVSMSNVIIDIPLKFQNGLTMRTFEALANKTKILTTNKNIQNTDFFNNNNIMVFENKSIDINFFRTKFDESFSLDNSYSIKNFILKLLKD